MGRIVKGCVREVSLAQVSCILMYVYIAPLTPVGAWSMALGLRQRFVSSSLITIFALLFCIGTPSTPERPLVEVDGPLAILSLRTSNSGTGDLVIPFSFNVLFYIFNSTEDRFEFSREEERFTSSDYTNNQNVLVHIEDVMELNQRYQFAARAVNKFGASAISSLSDPVLLNYSGNNLTLSPITLLH